MALSPTQETVRFGLFELDAKAARLTRNGSNIRLAQQPLRLLAVLTATPGVIVTREELRQRLWPSDIFIDFDHGLNKSMQKLREALGDSAGSPRYIETIPRVGYRFISPVTNGTRPDEVAADIPAVSMHDGPAISALPAAAYSPGKRWFVIAAAALGVCTIMAIAVYVSSRMHPAVARYTQLTDFTDSATTPALSPDGHMLAFIRASDSFMSSGEIYVKMLPNGEARPLTNDSRLKYSLAFSPDGSQIAYTVLGDSGFSTYSVSVLGGDPQLLLKNAAGLTWLDSNRFLFSELRSGLHMGIATQSLGGGDLRELYFPALERAMAHYSYASPDRQTALVVEMNGSGDWSKCQLISITGAFAPRPVGPEGACTAGGWSPDGSWMYFVATVEGQSHIWRQRFPDGRAEQITVSPAEEEGLAVAQDGRSIITSIGQHERSIWIHDATGDRSLSSEGEVARDFSPPSFAEDDRVLYYLLGHQANAHPELWRVALDTGKSEAVFPGTSMDAYDISPDAKEVAFTSVGRDGRSRLWVAPVDRSSPARQIGDSGETTPYFGRLGQVLFRITEGTVNYLEQVNQDGSARSKVLPYPIIEVLGISPGRRWLMAVAVYPGGSSKIPMVLAIPLDGGSPRRICAGYCTPAWSSSGRFLVVALQPSSPATPGRSLVIPAGPGETLPEFPPGGLQPTADPDIMPGATALNREDVVPGKDLSRYAYVETTAHHNLYRISLPR